MLVCECGSGLALPLDRRERGIGPAPLGGFLDRRLNLTEPPADVRNVVGYHLDPGGKGCLLGFYGPRGRSSLSSRA
jgi:hypothetical protein